MGMYFRRPPILRMSCSWCIAMITEPAARNSSALKKACVIRWKIAPRVGRDAERHRHVAELRQRRVRHHALDVVLTMPRKPMNSAVVAPITSTKLKRRLRQLEQRRHARHHEDAGRHHRRGVDQRRDRRRAFHRVRQPDVQRHLGGLAHRADEQADADDRHRRPGHAREQLEARAGDRPRPWRRPSA